MEKFIQKIVGQRRAALTERLKAKSSEKPLTNRLQQAETDRLIANRFQKEQPVVVFQA